MQPRTEIYLILAVLVLIHAVLLPNILYDMKLEDVHLNNKYYETEKTASKVVNYIGAIVSGLGIIYIIYYIFSHK